MIRNILTLLLVFIITNLYAQKMEQTANGLSFTDSRDGQKYKIVRIENQYWMAQNLNYKIEDSYHYDEDSTYGKKTGRLYRYGDALSVCPTGWRLPNNEDWAALFDFLGGWDVAGGKLKSKTGWLISDAKGTDEFGMKILPGGYRNDDSTYNAMGQYAYFWTATDGSPKALKYKEFRYTDHQVIQYEENSGYMSVRCMKYADDEGSQLNNNNTNVQNNTKQVVSNGTQIGNGKRFALVIGNANYETAPLRNPENDAVTMQKQLAEVGFQVTKYTNCDYQTMKKAIVEFGTALQSEPDAVGLFYYAGHGIQVNGENYLVPIDAKLEKESDVEIYAINLTGLMTQLQYSANSMNIIILDACRNNPFARSFRSTASRGFSVVSAPGGSIVAYATAPGSVAADGEGANGLYTQELVKAMKNPGMKIEDVFKQVRVQIKQLSGGKQIPWENSSLEKDFYFVPK